jgi:hypothetical protein
LSHQVRRHADSGVGAIIDRRLGSLGAKVVQMHRQLGHARRKIDWRDAKLENPTFEMEQLKRVTPLSQSRRCRTTAVGRALPGVNVGCLVAQLGGQLSGSEFDGVAVAGRPAAVLGRTRLSAENLTVALPSRCHAAFRGHNLTSQVHIEGAQLKVEALSIMKHGLWPASTDSV